MMLRTAFEGALPAECVVTERRHIEAEYGCNVTALLRQISLVLRPCAEDQVMRIVSIANAERIPLYPFSTGKNWGLGSKLPVVDGCVIVDLSGMARIVEVSEESAYTIIEPGVTQMQLAEHLEAHHPSLTLNFTGSYAYTGIVGNVLERGDGATARADDLLGVRGVLGNGDRFAVGGVWDHVGSGRPSHYSRFTAGPDLTGMFAQSAFGIVTAMAFRLVRKPERRYLLWGAAPDGQLERVVEVLDRFGAQGVVNRGTMNLGYENRFVQAERTLRGDGKALPESVWNFYVGISGTTRTTDALAVELSDALRPLCVSFGATPVEAGRDVRAELPPFLQPLAKPLMGFPDAESIKLIYRLTGTPVPDDPHEIDVDRTPFGMKCCIPVIPFRGADVRCVAGIVADARKVTGLENVKLSFFGDGRTLITIHFRTDDADQVGRAERCERMLWDRMVSAGYPPYRVAIDQMDRLMTLRPAFFDLVAQLKGVLDPNGIIAPGRYSPQRDAQIG